MSIFSLRRYLPCIDIVSRFYQKIFPNAIVKENCFTTAQQMAQKPYQRFYHTEPSFQLPGQYRNVLLDERCGKRCSYVRPNVTKRTGKTTGKSSESLVMRRNRRTRTMFTTEQVSELEHHFKQCNYVNSERAEELAVKLSLDTAPVKCWFKNQRRRVKLKEDGKQASVMIQDDGRNESAKTVKPVPTFVCKGLRVPPPPPLTPLPTVDDVGTAVSINLSFDNQKPLRTKQTRAQNSLLQIATSTPTQFVQKRGTGIPMLATSAATQPVHERPISGGLIIKRPSSHEPVFRFDNILHTTHIPSPMSTTGDIHSLTAISNNSDTSDYFSQISPNSEIYEPLTPSSVHSEAESVFNDILDSLSTPKSQPTIENIYEKLISAPEPNFNCALDTISQPHKADLSYTNSTKHRDYLELV